MEKAPSALTNAVTIEFNYGIVTHKLCDSAMLRGYKVNATENMGDGSGVAVKKRQR